MYLTNQNNILPLYKLQYQIDICFFDMLLSGICFNETIMNIMMKSLLLLPNNNSIATASKVSKVKAGN